MATHSSILACEIPWTEEPGGLQSIGAAKIQTCRGNELSHTEYPTVYTDTSLSIPLSVDIRLFPCLGCGDGTAVNTYLFEL